MKKLFIILAVVAIFSFLTSTPKSADFSASDVDPECDVIMYTASWCPACTQTKAYFDRKDYPYCEYDIETNAPEVNYYRKLGTRSIPTLLIGNQVVVGGKYNKIDKLIRELE